MLLHYFIAGGLMMYPLLICSILIVAIIFNRAITFYRAETDEKRLMVKIREFLSRGVPEGAVALCDRTSGPVAAILKAGLAQYVKGKHAMEEAFETAALYEIPRLERYLAMLSTIASISTLMGFTGTVTGMISAFNAIAKANLSSPAIVASGVAEALITTAAGLIIALPAIVSYRYFAGRVDKHVLEIEKRCKELVIMIENMEDTKKKEGKEK